MLVYLWCTKLWLCFHCSLGQAVSHSQALECTSGSFIQSHCPWMTLCPSSMFSMILASPSIVVPATQAGGNALANRAARPPAASPRWSLMASLMYAASAVPRDSSMSRRIWSSSCPIASMSASVRWANCLMSVTATQGLRSVLVSVRSSWSGARRCRDGSDAEHAVAGRGGDAGLDAVAFDVYGAVAQVADGAGHQRDDAGLTDAHAASERHLHADLLACLEQGRRTVDLGRATTRTEGDGAAFAAGTVELGGEPLHVQLAGQVMRVPHPFGGVEHRRRAARPGLAFDPVRHHVVQVLQREHAHRFGDLLVQPERLVLFSHRVQLVSEQNVALGRRRVDQMDIGHAVSSVQHPQHAHDGSQPRTAGQEEDLLGRRVRQNEVALGCRESDYGPRGEPADQVLGQEAFGHRFDRDADGGVVFGRDRGERVGPPVPAAVDLYADADVLARLVLPGPTPTRLDDQRGGMLGLRDAVDDDAAELAGAPQRVEQVQIVVGQQRRGDPAGDGAQRNPRT